MLVLNKPSGPGAESFVARIDLIRSSFLDGGRAAKLELELYTVQGRLSTPGHI